METPMSARRKSNGLNFKRRSLACTPATTRKEKDSQTSSSTYSSPQTGITPEQNISQNDDEAELRQRHRNRVVELHQKAFASPKINAEKRKSLTLPSGVTNSAIAEHYKSCIKLSTENKITTKNAFELNLIDYMPYMFRKQGSDLNNFQVASCTLDAGVKIYACRVDAVHTDIMKMAGGLGKENTSLDGNDGDKTGVGTKSTAKQPKSKPKRGENVENKIGNIDATAVEPCVRINPLIRQVAGELRTQNQTKSFGFQYFNALEFRDSSNVLLAHSNSVPNFDKPSEDFQAGKNTDEITVTLPDLDQYPEICPEVKGFYNPGWKFAEGNFPLSPNKRLSVLPPQMDFLDEIGEQDQVPPNEESLFEGMDDLDRESDHELEHLRGAGPNLQPASIATIQGVLEKGPLEYSYFSAHALTMMGRAGWAGPLHWKLKPIAAGRGQEDGGTEKKKRKKDPLRLCYGEEAPDFQTVKTGLSKPKVSMQLTHATCKQWNTSKITLPNDIHHDTASFGQFHLYPALRVTLCQPQTVGEAEEVRGYNFESQRDADNFCPASQDEDDGEDNGGGFATCAAFGDTRDGFEDDLLVAEPNKVHPEIVNYAKKAKNMDMKKLKAIIWNTITKESKPTEDMEGIADSVKPKASVDFHAVYKSLPNVLPPKMAANLSVSLAFIATLHLANENDLELVEQDDLRSFTINQS